MTDIDLSKLDKDKVQILTDLTTVLRWAAEAYEQLDDTDTIDAMHKHRLRNSINRVAAFAKSDIRV